MALLDHDPAAFPKLDDTQIAALGKFAKLRTVQPGETLIAAGERDYNFFVIKSGEVDVVDNSSGQEVVVAVHERQEFTGDVDMLTGRTAIASVVARTACEVYEISPEDLRRILGELPKVSDVLLRAFIMRRQLLEESGFSAVRVVGSRYSRDTHRIRQFLAKNKVPFSWIDLENDSQVDALLNQFRVTPDQTPVVVCCGNMILRNPSNAEVGELLGIKKPLREAMYDLAIVGAGPAGLAAAVYGASDGLKTVILDKSGPGGQASCTSRIENYMGFPTGLSGSDLANRAVLQAEKFGARLSAPAPVVQLSSENGYHVLRLESGEEVHTKCVLISSGATYRKLDVEGSDRFEGSGVYYAATSVEAQLCRDAQVVIVGGGNSAGQAAVYLSERASKVLLLIRGDDLGKSMSYYLARRIEQTPNIAVRRHTEITRMTGDKWLSTVELRNNETGESETVVCAAVFVFIGAVPHTEWLPDGIQLDPKGFVKTGIQLDESNKWPLRRQPFFLETSRPGVFAAGDARLGSVKRVASAVGEGAMTVQFAHAYLASGS
jgi:thioredoxin reductase (NADPH)